MCGTQAVGLAKIVSEGPPLSLNGRRREVSPLAWNGRARPPPTFAISVFSDFREEINEAESPCASKGEYFNQFQRRRVLFTLSQSQFS